VNGETSLLQRIAGRLPYLPTALRQVGEYVLERPDTTQSMSITALASEVGVAESTVSRFVREIGLSGYQALRLGIAEAAFAQRAQADAPAQRFVYDGIAGTDGPAEVIAKIRHSSEQTLVRTAEGLDAAALERAVQALEQARTVVFTCMGSSSIAAEDGVMRFTRAGKRCLLYRDQSLQAMVATVVDADDLVIAISDSGRSTSVIEVVRNARAHGAAAVAITSAPGSPLARAADIALFTASVPSGGALYGESVTAKWGQLLVVDALYATFAARHFDATVAHLEETYAAGIKSSRAGATD
jgi:RpiR family transcriptional regulator, carbohydrate utilization regulator